ncbi:AsmA family protein [Photobacterium sp. GB-50]|uniref:AsmA family protein n=1 Tax=Photobacterium sp. GB-50 TaxID=2022107 RepID=UPI000D162F97|nr:AsmA family protein [Photobacterium sp. GB-50]PSW74821.1 AsmA family protein [Photobacterium sp. GB-50]
MKKLLYVLIGIIIVVVLGITALVTLVNPNQFKAVIAEQVKKQTGRELDIRGDINWRFFPTLGLSVGETTLNNPQGFAQPNLIQFKQAELSVSVLPLLSHELDIGKVRLDGAHVFVQTLKDGRSNLDGLTEKSSTKEVNDSTSSKANKDAVSKVQDEKSTASKVTTQPWKISLAGVELINASVDIINDKIGSNIALNKVNFTLDKLTPNTWTKATFDISGSANALKFAAKGSTELNLSSAYQLAELKNLDVSLTAQDGKTEIKHAQVTLDHFQYGQWATVNLNIDGQLPELAFVTKGQTQFKLSSDRNILTLENLSIDNALSGKALPRPKMQVNIKTNASYDITTKTATLSKLNANADELALMGDVSFINRDVPVIRFNLSSDNINLDNWLNKQHGQVSSEKPAVSDQAANNTSTEVASSTSQQTSSPSVSNTSSAIQEPDLSVLKGIDVDGTIMAKKFTISHAHLSDVKLSVVIQNGIAKLNSFTANLYKGTVSGTAQLNVNTPLASYQLHNQIKGVEIQPLLEDVANNKQLAGRANIIANLAGKGLSSQHLKNNSTGTINVNLTDGAVYGVNISEMIRSAKARLKGEKLSDSQKQKKTDFSSLTALLQLGQGQAKIDNLHLVSPLLDINGRGTTNLNNESLNFSVDTAIVASGKGLDELKGITVPIKIKGTWQQPKYQLDLKNLFKQNSELEQKAKKELNRGLEKLLGDKAKDEKIKNVADQLLKGLFN